MSEMGQAEWTKTETHLNPLEFLARVLIHIPEPNKHLVHFYGVYANRVRSTYRNEDTAPPDEATDATPPRRAVSKRWAELIYRIYEIDPLTCRQCGAPMKILAFITKPSVRRILDHDARSRQRAPPAYSTRVLNPTTHADTRRLCLPAVDSESTNLNSSFPLPRAYTSKLDFRFITLSRSPSGSFLGATLSYDLLSVTVTSPL